MSVLGRHLSDPGGSGSCANTSTTTHFVSSPAQLRDAVNCADFYATGDDQIYLLYVTQDILLQRAGNMPKVAIALPSHDTVTSTIQPRRVHVSIQGHPQGTMRVIKRDVSLGTSNPKFALFDVYKTYYSTGVLT